MSAFSLETAPFTHASGGAFYFSTPALEARCEELCAAIPRGHVLLVDEAASGKSTMLDSVVEAAYDGWRVFRLQANACMGAKDFVHALVSVFGLPTREPAAAALRDADALLEVLTAQSQIAVIVIDDAHRLEPGALDQLLYLARRWQQYSVRFVVSAEPSLATALDARPAEERFAAQTSAFGMPRFDREQVNDYLHLCLFRAGLVGDSPFDPDTVARVAERARGLVGAIDPIARELLDRAASAGQGRSSAAAAGRKRMTVRRWSVAVVAAAALGVLLTLAVPEFSRLRASTESMHERRGFQSSITLAPRQRMQRASASADAVAP